MTTCAICFNGTADPPATMMVHGDTYVLCDGCSNWGYLRLAEENQRHRDRQWCLDRIEGARNAAQWSGRSARRYAPSWPFGGGHHLDRNVEIAP